jgi:hypothetical protein
MPDEEEDEKTRLIRRKTPPDLPAAAAPVSPPTRMIEPEPVEGEHTKLVGAARRSSGPESASSHQPGDGGELDPVVGWLVVLSGPGRGNARRLGYGQNSLGRDKSERVSLEFGDGSISRSKHCFVLYEPRKRQYFVRPGDGANLTYLNGELLAEPKPLSPADVIEIGATKLKFVPLCGPQFDWGEDSNQ